MPPLVDETTARREQAAVLTVVETGAARGVTVLTGELTPDRGA